MPQGGWRNPPRQKKALVQACLGRGCSLGCMHMHMHMHIHMHICMCMRMHMHMSHAHAHACTCTCTCMCMHVHVHVHVHACACMCMRHVHVHVHAHVGLFLPSPPSGPSRRAGRLLRAHRRRRHGRAAPGRGGDRVAPQGDLRGPWRRRLTVVCYRYPTSYLRRVAGDPPQGSGRQEQRTARRRRQGPCARRRRRARGGTVRRTLFPRAPNPLHPPHLLHTLCALQVRALR